MDWEETGRNVPSDTDESGWETEGGENKKPRKKRGCGPKLLIALVVFVLLILISGIANCARSRKSEKALASLSTTAASSVAAASVQEPGSAADASAEVDIPQVESGEGALENLKQRGSNLLGSLLGSDTYESIYADYSAKLDEQTSTLINEFNSEADASDGTTDALAKICNDKIEVLAKTCNEGIEKMASLMYRSGDDYSTYEEWAGKLMDDYYAAAQQIQDAYLDRAL